MAIRRISIVLIIFVWLLSPVLATAQEEKFKAIGISGTIFLIDPEFSFFSGSFEWKFSRHWSVQPEINIVRGDERLFLFPTIFVSYNFHFGKKYNLFPYLSIGGGGWLWEDGEGEGGGFIICGIKAGMRKIIVRDSNKAWALNFGVLFPYGIWVSIGLELCLF